MEVEKREPEAPGRHSMDDFGIPLPDGPKEPRVGAGSNEIIFKPQPIAHKPSLLRSELEAFTAASPSPSYPGKLSDESSSHTAATNANANTADSAAMSEVQPKRTEQQPEPVAEAYGSQARAPTVEHEAARLAAQHAANTAAREAALARKRQIVQEEQLAAAAGKKAQRAAAAAAYAGAAAQQFHQGAKRRRTYATSATTTASAIVKRAASPAAAAVSTWSVLGYISAATLAVGLVAALFVVVAVAEDALLDRPYRRKSGSGGGAGDWLALTRGLWRRCRRAFSAARKQLTGHGSDLPLSAHEGAGPLARAFAAAAAFVHVFWTHLVDSRGQHLAGAVTAAIDASRRASQGGGFIAPDRTSAGGCAGAATFVPDRESGGGAYTTSSASSSPAYYAPNASPFAAPTYQQRRRT